MPMRMAFRTGARRAQGASRLYLLVAGCSLLESLLIGAGAEPAFWIRLDIPVADGQSGPAAITELSRELDALKADLMEALKKEVDAAGVGGDGEGVTVSTLQFGLGSGTSDMGEPVCRDHAPRATDRDWRSCWEYSKNERGCRAAVTQATDDSDFSAAEMCCACGGGANLSIEKDAEQDMDASEFWTVNSGPCKIKGDGYCVRSPHWPSTYFDNEECHIGASLPHNYFIEGFDWPRFFATEERRDVLTVNGQPFSGSDGPPRGLNVVGNVTWSSDFSMTAGGWEMCARTCPAGEMITVDYVNGTGLMACKVCEAGTVSAKEGSFECVICPAGQYSAKEAGTACEFCENGTYSGVDGMTEKNCPQCSPGRFSDQPGMSACRWCAPWSQQDGREGWDLWSSMEKDPGGIDWVEVWGSTTEVHCGCIAHYLHYEGDGAYYTFHDGHCIECTEGLICPGMMDLQVVPGYFSRSDTRGFVWRCYEDVNFYQCPGGDPGTCGEGRLNTSIACLECGPGLVPALDRTCTDCNATGAAKSLLIVSVVLVGLIAVYHFSSRENNAMQSTEASIILVAMSLFMTAVQVMSVLDSVAVPWPSPFSEWLQYAQILTLSLTTIKVGCIVPLQPVFVYCMKLGSMFCMLVALCLIHIAYVVFSRNPDSSSQMRALKGSIGVVFMTFFIAIAKTIFDPAQCEVHPNGLWTMESAKDVVCFSTEFDSVHPTIIIIAFAVAFVPISFVAVAAWAVYRLPLELSKDNGKFLQQYRFLFFRFRPGCYWYSLVLVVRNLFMAMVPVIPLAFLQIFTMSLLILLTTFITPMTRPWRVPVGNFLECVTNFGVLFVLIFAGVLIPRVDADPETVSQICCAILVSLLAMFGVSIMYAGWLWLRMRVSKTYAFFICYDKQGSASFARLMERMLNARAGKSCYIEADTPPSHGGALVAMGDSDFLLAVCSPMLLRRPWCLGQLVSAHKRGIGGRCVLLRDFKFPERDRQNAFFENLPGLEALAVFGITRMMVVEALVWMRDRIDAYCFVTDASPTYASAESLAQRLWDCVQNRRGDENPDKITHSIQYLPDSLPDSSSILVVDHENHEALLTAFVIQDMLRKALPEEHRGGSPQVLGEGDAPPQIVTKVFAICSQGCLSARRYLPVIVELQQKGADFLPIVVDDNFHFSAISGDRDHERIKPIFSGSLHYFLPGASRPELERCVAGLERFLGRRQPRLFAWATTRRVEYLGRVRETGTSCIASFPGSYADLWEAANLESTGVSVACVFLHDELLREAEKCSDPCLCHEIYGARSSRDHYKMGYVVQLPPGMPAEEQDARVQQLEEFGIEVVMSSDSAEEKQRKEESAKSKFDSCDGKPSWGCRWFQDWKQNVEKALRYGQRLKVYYFEGNAHCDSMTWESLSTAEHLWDGDGLGASQKIEVAWLRHKGYPFKKVDVTVFEREIVTKRAGPQYDFSWVLGTKTAEIFQAPGIL